MAKKPVSAECETWNRPFVLLGDIFYWVFWTPILYIIIAPWLSLGVITYWANPIFAGFFNAMASTGWLVVSVIAFVWSAGAHAHGYYQQRQSKKKFMASLAEKNAQKAAAASEQAASEAVKVS
ncbi:hypothetical protein [Pseudomonas putida]|uniref:Uncharacterized protein n=1 Tax=Pseudomonas putida TaxID=303 RepID=A0A7V8EAJ0_PSEPU|nr:hypothetical protein [Pseudomonas putida]KAF0251291.1 hypothetical protein GN299_29405 [Pseudomonas putida]